MSPANIPGSLASMGARGLPIDAGTKAQWSTHSFKLHYVICDAILVESKCSSRECKSMSTAKRHSPRTYTRWRKKSDLELYKCVSFSCHKGSAADGTAAGHSTVYYVTDMIFSAVWVLLGVSNVRCAWRWQRLGRVTFERPPAHPVPQQQGQL